MENSSIDTREIDSTNCNCSLCPKNNCKCFQIYCHCKYHCNCECHQEEPKQENFYKIIQQNINENNINENKVLLRSFSVNNYNKSNDNKNLYNNYLDNINLRFRYLVNMPKVNLHASNLNILMDNNMNNQEKENYNNFYNLSEDQRMESGGKNNLINYKKINNSDVYNCPKNIKQYSNYNKTEMRQKYSNRKRFNNGNSAFLKENRMNKISKNLASNLSYAQNLINHYNQYPNEYYQSNININNNNHLSDSQLKFSPIKFNNYNYIKRNNYQNNDNSQNIYCDYNQKKIFDKRFIMNESQKKFQNVDNLSLYYSDNGFNTYTQNVSKSFDHLYPNRQKLKQSNIINNNKNNIYNNSNQSILKSRYISLINNANKRLNIYNKYLNQINNKINKNENNPNENEDKRGIEQYIIHNEKYDNDQNKYISCYKEKSERKMDKNYDTFEQIMNKKINDYNFEKDQINKNFNKRKIICFNNSCDPKIKHLQYTEYLRRKQENRNIEDTLNSNKKNNNISTCKNLTQSTQFQNVKNLRTHYIKETNYNKFKEKKQKIAIYNNYIKDYFNKKNNCSNNKNLNENDKEPTGYYINSDNISLMKNIVGNNQNKNKYEYKSNNNNFVLNNNSENSDNLFRSPNKNITEVIDNNLIKTKKNDNDSYLSDYNSQYFNSTNNKFKFIEQKIKYNNLYNNDINEFSINNENKNIKQENRAKDFIRQRVSNITYDSSEKNNQKETQKPKNITNNIEKKKSIQNNTFQKKVIKDVYENVRKPKNKYLNLKNLSTIKNKKSLVAKLKIDTNLSIEEDNIILQRNINISTKTIFTLYTISQKLSILCFDLENRIFSLRDFADFGNFEENYNKSKGGTILISIGPFLYIVTGKNNDMFYVFDSKKKVINKLCILNNNHSNGGLIKYDDENILCVSGEHNKKVEIYNINTNKWITLNETLIERSNFGHCLFKNEYLFLLFGYNYLTNEYLNTIEFLNINNILSNSNNNKKYEWKYLKYKNENLVDLNIKHFLSLNYTDNKIILIGGYNGNKDKNEENYIEIQLSENFENDGKCLIERSERKLKDIDKYNKYIFNKGESTILDGGEGLIYNAGFDSEYRCHIIQQNYNLSHDVYCYSKT